MMDGRRFLGVVAARGGSKRIPRKNLRPLEGKPLVAWAIEAGKRSQWIDRLILSSEDEEIIATAGKWGCEVPFVRPRELADDLTPGIDPVIHAITQLPGFDYVVLLQPTSPLRVAEDIDGCISRCVAQKAPACVSVTRLEHGPQVIWKMENNGRLSPLLEPAAGAGGREDAPAFCRLNGAVYVAECRWLLANRSFLTAETIGYEMPADRSVDIDSEADLAYAALLLSRRGHAEGPATLL
jgi:N-acylneuraminate cytidylyltransferase